MELGRKIVLERKRRSQVPNCVRWEADVLSSMILVAIEGLSHTFHNDIPHNSSHHLSSPSHAPNTPIQIFLPSSPILSLVAREDGRVPHWDAECLPDGSTQPLTQSKGAVTPPHAIDGVGDCDQK